MQLLAALKKACGFVVSSIIIMIFPSRLLFV